MPLLFEIHAKCNYLSSTSERLHMRFSHLLPLLFTLPVAGQTSTFDTGNEGWSTFGDATSPNATWISGNGNPGGHIRATDQSSGGTWHFVAPDKFLGNKCDAYNSFFRYDQYTSDTTEEDLYGDRPDVLLFGAGLVLVIENAENPNLDWTHYDILLNENAGWRLNSITGAVPTQAEIQSVLSDLTELRIRGEYRPNADYGGLDNVVLESNFGFDLDGDNSSGLSGSDFRSDTLCQPFGAVIDLDGLLFSGKSIDSIVVQVQNAGADEFIEIDAIPGNLDIQNLNGSTLALKNTGTATAADFLLALQLLHYTDLSLPPVRGTRTIQFRVFSECGEIARCYTYLPVFPRPDAGDDGDTLVCAGSPTFDLFGLLGGSPEAGGIWQPATAAGKGLFDPAKDPAGRYAYSFPKAGECPLDTAYVNVAIQPSFQLRPDTTLCFDDTLLLVAPSGASDWEWSTGSSTAQLAVTAPGTYALTAQTAGCTFTDSVRVDFYTCLECPHYAPNVFSPNDDGDNDVWQVFLPCNWLEYRLEVYDRWGNLVFAADDPERGWDGYVRDHEPLPGVYVWRLQWTGELFGVPKEFRAEGDVTVIR